MKKVLIIAVVTQLLVLGKVHASDWITIPDMSQLSYQVTDNKVWLRNVNQFDGTWLGCCTAYYIDLSTDSGKATWSTMLTKIATKDKYNIGVIDKTQTGSPVTFSGEW